MQDSCVKQRRNSQDVNYKPDISINFIDFFVRWEWGGGGGGRVELPPHSYVLTVLVSTHFLQAEYEDHCLIVQS